jgi:hypothetical protein
MELKEIMQKEAFQEKNVSFTAFFYFAFLTFGFQSKKIKR